MRRVAVTGLGIVSSIGNDKDAVVRSLKDGKSGIKFCQEYADRGFRSHVHGAIDIDIDLHIDRKLRRFMGDGAAYNYIAMVQAIADSGLTENEVSNERTGLVVGSGGPSTSNLLLAWNTAQEKGAKRVGPYMVPRTMSSTNSATPRHALPHQGRQLHDQLGLLHQRPLHRQWRGTDPVGQAGHRLRRGRRGTALDNDRPVRRHARAVVGI